MNRILALMFSCTCAIFAHAQYFKVVGTVADSSHAPIPGVNIFLKNGSVVGSTDVLGSYSFELGEGQYELVFSHPEYMKTILPIVLSMGNDTVNVVLQHLTLDVGTVQITAKRIDPGPEMMRKAIAKRDYWKARQPDNTSTVYIRAWENFKAKKKPENVWHNTEDDWGKGDKKKEEDMKKHGPEVQGNMAEIILKRDWMSPNKLKETRDGVSIRGDRSGLYFLSTTEGNFDFYTHLVKIPALSDMPVMSPLSSTALLAYKFSFLGSYKNEKGQRVLKISMTPRLTSNSVFKGEIHIIDTLFVISQIRVEFPKNQLNEYNDFVLQQEYKLLGDTAWVVDNQRFDYFSKTGKGKFNAYTLVKYKDYELNKKFSRNHFGLEVSSTSQEAYERDSGYWNRVRETPLNNEEIRYINYKDSVKRVVNSDRYKDSMEKIANKLSFPKVVLFGSEYQRHRKGLYMNFQPLFLIYQPWMIGGGRINLWNSISKEFKSKRKIDFSENISYGLNNHDIKGTVSVGTLYDPFHRGFVYVSAGRDFGVINANAALLDIARRNNFYQSTNLNVYHRREYFNGFYIRLSAMYNDRKDISEYKFDKLGDSLFQNNTPIAFENQTAVTGDITFSYTPFQKYIREPRQKVILGSKWPTFVVQYKKAIPGIAGANIDYEYLEYRIEHEFPIGLMGYSELRAVSGTFLNHKKLGPVDYRYQRRADPIILTPPMYAFQQLDSTFITYKRFYEAHYWHHFNGALINKIPLMKRLSLRESAGVSVLYAPERRNMLYYEFFAGFDIPIRLWRERFKLGLYYSGGYSNLYEKPKFGFKINVSHYDRYRNRW